MYGHHWQISRRQTSAGSRRPQVGGNFRAQGGGQWAAPSTMDVEYIRRRFGYLPPAPSAQRNNAADAYGWQRPQQQQHSHKQHSVLPSRPQPSRKRGDCTCHTCSLARQRDQKEAREKWMHRRAPVITSNRQSGAISLEESTPNVPMSNNGRRRRNPRRQQVTPPRREQQQQPPQSQWSQHPEQQYFYGSAEDDEKFEREQDCAPVEQHENGEDERGPPPSTAGGMVVRQRRQVHFDEPISQTPRVFAVNRGVDKDDDVGCENSSESPLQVQEFSNITDTNDDNNDARSSNSNQSSNGAVDVAHSDDNTATGAVALPKDPAAEHRDDGVLDEVDEVDDA